MAVIKLKENKTMKKPFFMIGTLALITCMFATDLPMKVYLCRKCSMTVFKNGIPNTANCSATGNHQWTNLGLIGTSVYLCSKCKVSVATAQRPNSSNCPATGSHSWNLLGKVGKDQYQCKKCKIRVFMDIRPNSGNCPSGGSHDWNKF
jgi:DNA-directed RNA polymerase subunit RPC12/RpoP